MCQTPKQIPSDDGEEVVGTILYSRMISAMVVGGDLIWICNENKLVFVYELCEITWWLIWFCFAHISVFAYELCEITWFFIVRVSGVATICIPRSGGIFRDGRGREGNSAMVVILIWFCFAYNSVFAYELCEITWFFIMRVSGVATIYIPRWRRGGGDFFDPPLPRKRGTYKY